MVARLGSLLMRINAHGETHRGLLRPDNEDAYLCGSTVYAVADGLGGLPAGEVASALAVQSLQSLDGKSFADAAHAQAALAEAVTAANQAVLIDARTHPARVGMATTLTAALVHDGWVVLAHVGDCRAYLLADGQLRQLTADHNPPGDSHILTRVIGEHDVLIDRPDPLELGADHRLLLCSDGLSDVVPETVITEALGGVAAPAAACERLVAAALDAGGPDNITVVALFAG
jgi:PPM family protein phosphatase